MLKKIEAKRKDKKRTKKVFCSIVNTEKPAAPAADLGEKLTMIDYGS